MRGDVGREEKSEIIERGESLQRKSSEAVKNASARGKKAQKRGGCGKKDHKREMQGRC